VLSDKVGVNTKHIAERMTQAKLDHNEFLAICEAYPTLTGEDIDDARRAIADHVFKLMTLWGIVEARWEDGEAHDAWLHALPTRQ
jgi:hypothetical protein